MDPDQKDASRSPKAGAPPKEAVVDARGEALQEAPGDEEASAHICGVCGRSFPLLSSLSQHMRRHTREKPYKCPYCEHRTAQKGSLKAHVRSHKLGLLGPHSPGPEEPEGAPGRGEDDAEATRTASPAPAAAVARADSSSEKEHGAEGGVRRKTARKKACREDADAEESSSGSSGGGGAGAHGPEEEEEAAEGAEAGPFPCSSCSQVFPQAALLKAHAKKHRGGSQDHGCPICGRRFRQAWFLQSHMRIHRAKAQLKGGSSGGGGGGQQLATVNGAPMDPATLANEECLYELCAGCGNFFYDRRSLQAHEKLHKQGRGRATGQAHPQPETPADPASKEYFLQSLSLRCVGAEAPAGDQEPAGRILELDPICSYQAWQIATKGRLAEATERGLGWEERLADAEVAYNREKGEYVALKQDKKRRQGGDATAPVAPLKKRKGGAGVLSGGHHGQTDRTLFNGLGHAFYVALQKKKLKEEGLAPAKPNHGIRAQSQKDKKPLFCERCDFQAADATSLGSHACKHRPGQHSAPKAPEDPARHGGSKDSKYMDYLRNRSALLSQPYWSPFSSLPGQGWAPLTVKKEKSEVPEAEGEIGGNAPSPVATAAVDGANLINLSHAADADGDAPGAGDAGGLVRHQCPYCAHTTNYPEVLWIHQRVAHRVDGASSAAPRWAPCPGGFKGAKAGATGGPWRRTGPPPFLEGKDCPAFPAPRTQRTQAPEATAATAATTVATGRTSGSANASTAGTTTGRRSTGKTLQSNPAAVKPRSAVTAPAKDSRSADGSPSPGRKLALPPPRKKSSSGERSHKAEEPGRSKSTAAATTASTPARAGSSSGGGGSSPYAPRGGGGPAFLRCDGSPRPRGHRVSVEGRMLPQEGLGFMLARSHAHSPAPHHSAAVHAPTQRDVVAPATATAAATAAKGRDLWSAMNLWGGSPRDGRGYAVHPLYAQGKNEAAPQEAPMDIDVLSLLKNYSPHDLAALYQHWGFVDPRMDPQAMSQLNGHFVNEVHSASEASRQVNSHNTPSSGSLQKGT